MAKVVVGAALMLTLILSAAIWGVRLLDGEVLAYVLADRNGLLKVHLLDLNTGIHFNLTANQGMAYRPAWLPCAEADCLPRLSYIVYERNGTFLAIYDLITGEIVQRDYEDNNQGYAWSPCGLEGGCARWLTYSVLVDGNYELYTDDGTTVTRVTFSPQSEVYPAWLPCTETPCVPHLSFWNLERNDVFVRNMQTGEEINVTNEASNDGWGAWSLDGRFIWPTSPNGANIDLFVLEAGSITNLTNDPQLVEWNPSVSPRGLIAYEGNDINFLHTALYLRYPDGRTVELVENGTLPTFMP